MQSEIWSVICRRILSLLQQKISKFFFLGIFSLRRIKTYCYCLQFLVLHFSICVFAIFNLAFLQFLLCVLLCVFALLFCCVFALRFCSAFSLCIFGVLFFVFVSCILHFGTHLKKEAGLQGILVFAVCISTVIVLIYHSLIYNRIMMIIYNEGTFQIQLQIPALII